MSNNISFVGRVGSDPELKEVGSSTVLEFRVANDTGFGDRKNTNWFRCAYWGKRAQALEPHLEKGKQIFITGELTLRKYTDREGVERWSPDVNVNQLDFVGGNPNNQGGMGGGQEGAPQSSPAPAPTPETDEDMPF
jgi:single-strand DNA-binding protein